MLTIAAKRGIDLEDIGTPFLEDIIKSALSHSIPLDRNVLHLRDHISLWGVLFGKRVIRTDRDTLKHGRTDRIGCNGHIHTLTVFGDTGQAENQALHQAVFGGLADFDHTVLAQVGNVQSDKRTVIVDRHFPLCIAVRLVIDRNLGLFHNIIAIDDLTGFGIAVFVCRSDHGDFFTVQIIDSEFRSAEVLSGFGVGFQNFNMPLFEPVIGIDRCQTAMCGINGDLPFRLTVRLIVKREGRLDHSVGAVRNICGFGISTIIGRPDGRYLCARHIVDRKDGSLERLIGTGRFFIDLNIALFQLIDGLDRYHAVIGSADCAGPLLGSRIGVVCRENRFHDPVGAKRQPLFGAGVAAAVGRTDGIFCSGRGIGGNKIGTAQCCALRILFIDFDFAGCLYEFRSNDLYDGFRVVTLRHADDGADFRSSIVTDMGHEMDPIIISCIECHMCDIPGRNVFENDERTDRYILAGNEIIAVRILAEADAACRSGTDPRIRSSVVCRCGAQIIWTGCAAGVNARNVGQIVVVHIRNIGGTAKTAALEFGDIRCEPGCRTAFCDGLRAVLIQPVGDFREIGRCAAAVLFENRSVILLRLHLVAGVFQSIQIDVIQHIGRNIRCRRRKNARRQH